MTEEINRLVARLHLIKIEMNAGYLADPEAEHRRTQQLIKERLDIKVRLNSLYGPS